MGSDFIMTLNGGIPWNNSEVHSWENDDLDDDGFLYYPLPCCLFIFFLAFKRLQDNLIFIFLLSPYNNEETEAHQV